MATLTGKKISESYKDLLQISNSNAGVDATLRDIEDGEGTASILQISSASINIKDDGALQINETAITSTAAELNFLDGANTNITTLTLPANTTISTFGKTIVDDADAAAVRTTLGLGAVSLLASIDISANTNLAASTGITLTGDTLTTNDGQIVHDNLSGFVANEHIDWTSDQGSTNLHAGNYIGATTSNITSAGALMDSEVSNLSFVKALTGGISDGNVLLANAAVSDNDFLKIDGTSVEGRTAGEVRSDLNIEDGATADQTNAEIRTAVEAATDSNVFTDADHSKLNAIEASADITDAANVTSAGALMDSEVTDLDGIKSLTVPNDTTISATAKTLLDDASVGAMRTTLGVDAAGTDNSTDVSLGGSLDYITISGQTITRNAVDLAADVTGTLPVANGGTGATSLNNLITLTSHTTGNYAAAVQGTTNEIEVSGSAGEGTTFTIGLPDDVTIAGDLTINGDLVTVTTENLVVQDPLIKLAKDNNGADSVDIGFYGLYDTSGSQDLYAGLFRDANDSGKFKLFKNLQAEPTTTVNVLGTGYAVGTLVAALEGNATTATTLASNRAFSLAGDVTASGVNFNGSAAVELTTTIAANAVEGSMLNTNVIFTQTNMTGDVADADELLISDAGTLKRIDFSVFRDAIFADLSGLTDMTEAMVAGDEFIVLDGAVEKRKAFSEIEALLNHDSLAGFVSAEHVDWAASSAGTIHSSNYSNTQLSQEQVEDFAGAMVASGGTKTGIAVTYQDGTGDMDFVVDHDAANNFVANEHIDHTAVAVNAGKGLSGGGNIASSITLTFAGSELDDMSDHMVAADEFLVLDSSDSSGSKRKAFSEVEANLNHDNLASFVANEHIDWTADQGSTNIHAGNYTDTNTNQLTTFQLEDGDGTEVQVAQGKEIKFIDGAGIDINWTNTSNGTDADPFDLTFTVDHDAANNFVANEHVDHSGVSIASGDGLSGGGNLLSSRTLAFDGADLTDMTDHMLTGDEFVVLDGSNSRRKAAGEIRLSIFNNDSGFTTNTGDITGITTAANSGLTGGGTSGTVSLVVDHLKATDDRDVKPNAITTSAKAQVRAYFTSLEGLTGSAGSDYQDLLVLDTYVDGSGGDMNALAFDKSTQNIYHYLADQGDSTWGTAKRLAYIENGSNNRVMTASSSSTVNGEGNLTFDGTNLTVAHSSGAVIFAAAHAADKIQLYSGGNEKIGTEANTMLFTADNYKFKDVAGTSNLIMDANGSITLNTVIAGTWQGTAIASAYLDADTAHLSGTQTFTGAKTFNTGYLEIISQDGSEGGIKLSKSTVDGTHVRYHISHRDDNQSLIFYSHDGTTFRNWITLDEPNALLKLGSNTSALSQFDNDGDFFPFRHIDMGDGDRIKLGDSDDLQIVHDSNINFIHSTISDRDIYFRVNDGGSSVDAIIIDASDVGAVKLPNDNQVLYIGAGNDIYFVHYDNSTSVWGNNTGTLQIRNHTSDADMFLSVNDGGSHINAVQIDASDAGTATFNHDILLNKELSAIRFGASQQGSIYEHQSDIIISNSAAGNDTIFENLNSDSSSYVKTIFIDGSTSRVGIGTTGPDELLHVNGNIKIGDGNEIRIGNGNDLRFIHSGNTFMDNYEGHLYVRQHKSDHDIYFQVNDGGSTGQTVIAIDGSEQRIGIGTTSPQAKMDFSAHTSTTSDGDGTATMVTSGQDSILLEGHAGGASGTNYGSICWVGGSRRRAMITSVADGSNDTDIIGLSFYTQGTDGSGDFAESMRIAHDGNVHFDKDVVAFSSTPSDIRLKKNFTKIDNGLDIISKLEGHTFNWKKGEDRLSAGFKAQEVEKILPHLVDEKRLPLKSNDDKEYKSLRYEEVIPYLVEAIKEQQVQIDELKNKLGE